MILDMGNTEDTPLILGHPSLTLQMLTFMWLLGKSNSTLLEGKKHFLWWESGKEKASKENQDEETKADWRTGETNQEEE
jgi:hypothetical protein